MKIILPIICSIYIIYAFNSNSVFDIPQNEQTAENLIEQGKLDPAFWELVKPYYTQQIDVPQGELNILLELFPQLPANLPIHNDSLKKYLPWDEASKMRFFMDFPILLQFEPLLRFEIKNVSSRAKAQFFISGKDKSKPFSHGVNLTASLEKKIRVDTRINFTNDYARWYRRKVVFTPSENYSLQVGNFGSSFDKGLFFGYFPSSQPSKTKPIYNWLYGDVPTWNGLNIRSLKMGKNLFSRTGVSAFLHKRISETSFGGNFDFRFDVIEYSCGFSSLLLSDSLLDSNKYHYFHSGLKLKFRYFTSELQTGIGFDNPGAVPVYLMNKIGGYGREWDLLLIVIPREFHAPYSYFGNKLDDKEEKLSSTIVSVSVHSRYNPFDWISISPFINADFANKKIIDCRLKMSCTGSFGNLLYNVSYSWAPACEQSDTSDISVKSMLQFHFHDKVTIKSEFDILSCNTHGYSVAGSICTKLNIFPAISFNPSLAFAKTESTELVINYGIQQILTLGDRTFTEIKLEKPLKTKTKGELLRVEATSSFLF